METLILLTFSRVSGFVLGLPGGRTGFGLKWRAILAVLVTLLLIPGQIALLYGESATKPNRGGVARQGASSELDFAEIQSFVLTDLSKQNQKIDALIAPDGISLWVRAGQEILFGLAMGLSITIVFSALALFGKLVSTASGLSSSEILDPVTNEQTTPVSTFIWLVALTAFIGQGGDRALMETVLDSFQRVPVVDQESIREANRPVGTAAKPLTGEQLRSLYEPLTDLVQRSFILGLRLAIPALISLFIALLAVALISRTVPLINQLTVGMAANSLLFWGVMALGLGILVSTFQEELQEALAWTRTWS